MSMGGKASVLLVFFVGCLSLLTANCQDFYVHGYMLRVLLNSTSKVDIQGRKFIVAVVVPLLSDPNGN